jgi:uncharacterized membrane protein
MRLTHSVDIPAPIDIVWQVYTDVERWPQWMESMDHVDVMDGRAMTLGSEVWISQPRLPNATWEVTEFTPGRSWTWVSRSPGARSTATHVLHPIDDTTTRVEMTLDMSGGIGAVAGRMIAKRALRYMTMEGDGLRAACDARRSA